MQSRTVSNYERMSFHLETRRLILRPWAETYANELCALHSERGNGTPAVEYARSLIARQLAATETTGIALLPIHRRDEGCLAWRGERWTAMTCLQAERFALDKDEQAEGDQHERVQEVPPAAEDSRCQHSRPLPTPGRRA